MEGPNGLVTSCEGTAFWNALFKERRREKTRKTTWQLLDDLNEKRRHRIWKKKH